MKRRNLMDAHLSQPTSPPGQGNRASSVRTATVDADQQTTNLLHLAEHEQPHRQSVAHPRVSARRYAEAGAQLDDELPPARQLC